MSINNQKIVEMCKKQKRLILLWDGADAQWISDGYALYPLLGVPLLTEESVRALYAIPENVKVEVEDLPRRYNYDNAEREEYPVFYEKIQIQPAGEAVHSLRTRSGVVFIAQKALKVLDSGENGDCTLYERVDGEGNVYIVAKQGMMLEAVIPPLQNVLKADWLDDLQNLAVALRQTFEKEETKC